ncbi:4-(cytidine 5'-diphospho)-2-C-methyl-D-erythritol kinase [Gammaproteobacteria bacterium]|nr:4-(cytidine 5'-diphospho)-2-C-methyl-D-erythritol kinase [Gammaproteobacteria bacterium]
MSTLSLPSPAKINLFLHITGQRSDGYHNLQTLFQLLDFGDKLVFRSNRSGNIKINGNIGGVEEKNNLIFLAAMLLQKSAGCDLGCTIDLTKKLPMGAGLGGGSSNAATTLVGLNALWKCGLTANELSDLGKTLGADVPVFVHGESAFAEGIGDILTPVTLPQRWFLVITPNCHVSTREIFSNPQLTRNSSPIKIRALSGVEYGNDCQDVVSTLYPAVGRVLQWAGNFSAPLMTGTGASVFCSFDSKSEAQQVLSKMPKQWAGFVAKGVNRSPVHEQLHDFFTGASPSG